jgi:hypothetical protein
MRERCPAEENRSMGENRWQFGGKGANLSVLMAKVKAMEIVLDEG